ncbi:MAG: stage III sporulation protein AF, partial [Clostridium sp.]
VELIIPKGNINKYVRLGTGLLVMVVVLSPIFKILNNNFNLEEGINSYTKSISAYEGVDTKKAQDKFKKSTQESFK